MRQELGTQWAVLGSPEGRSVLHRLKRNPAESAREGNLGLEGAAGQGWFS